MLFRLVIVLLSWFTLLSCSSSPVGVAVNPSQTKQISDSLQIVSHADTNATIEKVNTPMFTNKNLKNNGNFSSSGNNTHNQYLYNNNYEDIADYDFNTITHERFNTWLNNDLTGQRKIDVNNYYKFVKSNAGFVPPLEQMLRSARSWLKCGFEPYGVPPREHWDSMISTIKLLKVLVDNNYLPKNYQLVSVYRDANLNSCAKGSRGSKHILNAAVDLRVNYIDNTEREIIEDGMCRFWYEHGKKYNFGFGLYKTGTIHLDTQGFRTWGSNYGASSSRCVKLKYKYIQDNIF